MKMITVLKIVLVVGVVAECIEDDLFRYSTEISVVESGTVRKETPSTDKPITKYPWEDLGHKPFFYGRKFELPNQVKENNEDELVAPIITSPIRALGREKTEGPSERVNEISDGETTEKALNGTFFPEDVGGDVTTEDNQDVSSREERVSKSRQDGDRSLMVVLPFKANNNDNIQDLFTKSPFVKVIESSDDLGKELGADFDSGSTQAPTVIEREIIPQTKPQRPIYKYKRRWLPSRRPTTVETDDEETDPTIEPAIATTTENGEDATKTYTNYNDVEMVTKKFETGSIQTIINHKYEPKVTPYPILVSLKKKTKLQEEEEGIKPEETTSTPPSTKSKLKRKGQRRKPTTEGPPKPEELSKILEILPPDMQNILLEFGLNKEKKEEKGIEDKFHLERVPHPFIDPKSYAIFKPLPIETKDENRNFVPDDMKDFLASFGLLPTGNRVQKSLKPLPNKEASDEGFDWGFLPDDLKSVLEDMGLAKTKKGSERIHIFNPSNHTIAHSDEDREKLNAILTSIKATVNESEPLTQEMQTEIIEKIRDLNNLRYKHGNLSEINNEIQKIVDSSKASGTAKSRPTRRVTKLVNGPDPLVFSEESLSKNEVKRQDNTTSTSSSSSSSDASSSSSGSSDSSSSSSGSSDSSSSSSLDSSSEDSTTTTEGPNIDALKESFGGGETASDDEDIDSALPPKRPNGLYLLLDWNSFLEVGTPEDKRRVNIRFQPKAGDSRNFLSVTVP